MSSANKSRGTLTDSICIGCLLQMEAAVQSLSKVFSCECILSTSFSFSFSFRSRWLRSARKCPYALRLFFRQCPSFCSQTVLGFFFLVEHRSITTPEGEVSAAFFLHSSFLQTTSAMMLWPVHVQKIPQASKHLCLAKLQTRCDICCACKSVCCFIPSDPGVARAVDPRKSLQLETVHDCVSVRTAHHRL